MILQQGLMLALPGITFGRFLSMATAGVLAKG